MDVHMHSIQDEIMETLSAILSLQVLDAVPIHRGWLNLKWKVITDEGVMFVKQYSAERCQNIDLSEIYLTLRFQEFLHHSGIPCPLPIAKSGNLLHQTPGGQRFVVMPFCPGEMVKPGKLNEHQAHHLGRMTGKMHRLLNEGPSAHRHELFWIPPSISQQLQVWQKAKDQAERSGSPGVLQKLEKRRHLIERMNVQEFEEARTGWTHQDLWVDNLLFYPRELSSILDFDRLRYSYPELDVARSVLSGMLEGETLHINRVSAFLDGYREEIPFAPGEIDRSLRLIWWLESPYWLTENMENFGTFPHRFSEEMSWLMDHWDELDERLGQA